MVLDDERLKARIHFDERETLRDLDKVLKEIDKAFKKKKWTFKEFFGGEEGGKLDTRMVKVLQDFEKVRRANADKRLKDENVRDKRRQKDFGVFLQRRKVMWADHERNRLQKELHDRVKVERDIIRRISAMHRQAQEGVLDTNRVYAPGTVGDRAKVRYDKAMKAQQMYKVGGAGNRLFTFMSHIQKAAGVGPNSGDSNYETTKKAAAFQRKINPLQAQAQGLASGLGGRIPQLVKLAGFTMGIAGAAQFGKMVIDSSPMLQAILKIMNAGFTFILRPIGDMMGLIMRPLAIMLLKYGVAFYKESLKLFPTWTAIGDQVAAFFGGGKTPDGKDASLTNVGEALTKGSEDLRKGDEPGEFNPLANLFKNWGDQLTYLGAFIDVITKGLPDIGASKYEPLGYGSNGLPIQGPVRPGTYLGYGPDGYPIQGPVGPGNYNPVNSSSFGQRKSTGGTPFGGFASSEAQTKALAEAQAEIKRKYPHLFDQPGSSGTFGGYMPTSVEQRMKDIAPAYTNYANPLFATGGYAGKYTSEQRNAGIDRAEGALGISSETQVGDIPGIIASASSDFESLWDNAEDIMKIINNTSITGMDRETKMMLESIVRMKKSGDKAAFYGEQQALAMKGGYDKMMSVLQKVGVQRTNSGKFTSTAQAAKAAIAAGGESVIVNESGGFGAQLAGFRGSNGKVYSSAVEAINNNGPTTTATDISSGQKYKLNDKGAVVAFAKGGIINEPILGLGQRTGTKYLMGESGPETITPGANRGNNGGNNYFTFHITGIRDAEDFERVIMPKIKNLLKTDTSRRGIL